MKNNYALYAGAALAVLAMSSCSNNDDFVGTWQTKQPLDISRQIPAAASATSNVTITFGPDTDGKGGEVVYTSEIQGTQSVDENPGVVTGYEVSVSAIASVSGTWSYEPGKDDDLLITFDRNTIKVNVDPAGVIFRQNVVTDAQEPVTDSLTQATAAMWERQVEAAFREELGRYSRLDDVKVKNDNNSGPVLKFEIENPEQELFFIKN